MSELISSAAMEQKLFSDVKYFVTGIMADNVRKILDEGGAEKINFFSDMVTHCIVGENPRENDVSDAKDLYEVPAVTPQWVLVCAFCNKILPTKGFAYDSMQIFSGAVITASQLTNADFKAIWAMITFYGGKFKSNLDVSCTHLISGKPIGKKYEAAMVHSNIKVVTPDWVGESIKIGSKIEEDFFHPKYLLFPKATESSPLSAGSLSTAQILGFADEVAPSSSLLDAPSSTSSTQALLEKLKQRMPWNRPSSIISSSTTSLASTAQLSFAQSPYCGISQNKTGPPQQNQIQTTQSDLSLLPTSGPAIQQHNNQPLQQVDRLSLEQQPRMGQQGTVWRPATVQTVKPQYALIQRDGSIVQTHTGNWTQYHLQQQRLQQQASVQQPQHVQQQSHTLQPNPSSHQPQQPQQTQQTTILQNSQVPGQGSNTVQTHPTQRQITWTQQPQLQGPPKQVIQLDPQTHAQLSQMDPQQRTLFLQKIQRQRQIILQQRQLQLQQQQQHQQQPRAVGAVGKLGNHSSSSVPVQQSQHQPQQSQSQPQQNIQQQQPPMPIRQQQIIIRGVMPPGLTAQQQAVWLHQQQFIRQQQILVQQHAGQIRQPVNASQPRIIQQQTATSTWIPQADNQQQPQQQQQQQQQLQLQRQQQMRIQQLQIQKQQQIVVQRNTVPQQFQQTNPQQVAPNMNQTVHAEDTTMINQTVGSGGGLLVNNRTKTALANMLSSRLQTGHLSPQNQVLGQPDGTAAGQLRLMSAQQRTNQPPPPPPPGNGQLSESASGLYPQQRRTLSNISNSNSNVRPNMSARDVPASNTSIPVPKSPARASLTNSNSTTSSPAPQKPQFFAHNPSLRIPPDKYFLGCVFLIVEYDQCRENNVPVWEEIIREHGGEIESIYTHRVTHILCKTQKHGIVQQALRDGKRCITAFWLNDIVSRGSLSVPWLALHFPVPFGKEKPLSKYHMTLTGFEEKSERERVATMIRVAGGQYRNYLSPLTHIVVCRKADGAKYKKAKETNKVTVNVQWLNEILFGHYSCIQQPEVHKYQQYNLSTCFRVDYSLIPHLMGAWKLPINVTSEIYGAIKSSPPSARKTKKPRLEPTLEQRMELENKVLESISINNTENFTSDNRPYVMITGDRNLEVTKKVKELGCVLARSSTKITHLVVCGKPLRTLKMLKSLILAKYIVKDSWITDSYTQNKLLSEANYSIHQVDSDDFKCNISVILASPDRNALFKDKIFYITPNVQPSRNSLGELVTLCGGHVEKQRRSIKVIQELNKLTQTYIVISCYNDLALIADLFRAKLEFYHAEFVLKAVVTQSIDYTSSVYRY